MPLKETSLSITELRRLAIEESVGYPPEIEKAIQDAVTEFSLSCPYKPCEHKKTLGKIGCRKCFEISRYTPETYQDD